MKDRLCLLLILIFCDQIHLSILRFRLDLVMVFDLAQGEPCVCIWDIIHSIL